MRTIAEITGKDYGTTSDYHIGMQQSQYLARGLDFSRTNTRQLISRHKGDFEPFILDLTRTL